MNDAQTRFNKIDPKLRDAGWGIVPGSKILVEQSAYIASGRITTTGNKNPKKADYILEYKGMKLAVIEANRSSWAETWQRHWGTASPAMQSLCM